MGFWKILGGIAAGVGVVVALPVAGPIGAVTGLGAAIGGGFGALAGAAASVIDEEEKKDAHCSGEKKATAKYEEKCSKLIDALKVAEERLRDDKTYFELLIALFAVGMATANADSDISDEEIADLDEFIAGIGHSNLPSHVKETITRLKNNPPNFNTAMEYVSKLENIDLNLFESVIEVISASDGKVSEKERALLNAFRKAVA
ncbi:hypothetical protein R2083_09175 [Nitrosomonas sp. Is35]|uniref:hypothetical protein n=1 Tax=Nitrosomonas sp. Is35 TaxID=3080534 RepID=UPI00294B4CE5|nr:hypothetical protein [Nitrosomonas sp. Is35]MDV6347687.1 hypothetical protein [Nitrosomonas sp. Is35]